MKQQQRTFEQIKEHYEIEKQLAEKLRNSSRQERDGLYASLYDELFRRVPHHPQLMRTSFLQDSIKRISSEVRDLRPFLSRDSTFLEIGPGDCALSLEVARLVKKVYAVDVSEEITKGLLLPKNFELILSDGRGFPVSANTVDVAYSNQLMEHLHPDDALEQLQNIYEALAPGGIYICITPNRLSGPHDVSKYFDKVATGFHLREYTVAELYHLFRLVGFSRIRAYIRIKKAHMFLPTFPVRFVEKILSMAPYPLRKSIASSLPLALLLGIKLIGIKSALRTSSSSKR